MKIYIEETNNLILENLQCNPKKMSSLEKYLVNKQLNNKIYSKEGMYQIYDNKTYKLQVISDSFYRKEVVFENKKLTFLIDDSKITKTESYRIPYEHILLSSMTYTYKMDNKHLKLVVECINNEKEESKPVDYFFEYDIENNGIPIEDINVFLSLLK
jgi:hypothetical protein